MLPVSDETMSMNLDVAFSVRCRVNRLYISVCLVWCNLDSDTSTCVPVDHPKLHSSSSTGQNLFRLFKQLPIHRQDNAAWGNPYRAGKIQYPTKKSNTIKRNTIELFTVVCTLQLANNIRAVKESRKGEQFELEILHQLALNPT